MIELNPARFKTRPFDHQVDGIKRLVAQPAFALFDEMGSGKSNQVVNAACVLFEAGEVDCVLVVAPASCKSVWLNEEYGEIKKHAWLPSVVAEYHRQSHVRWADEAPAATLMPWLVTNYEYLRSLNGLNHRREGLEAVLRQYHRVWLVLDESSSIKSPTSEQYKAVKELRPLVSRCTLLNGTPVPNNPLDLWAQVTVLDPNILGQHYKNFYHFRYSHCNFGGWRNKQIIGWRDLEKVQAYIAPHCLRRLKKDCLDLPPKIGGIDGTPLLREVALSEETWRRYKRLRTEAILSLPDTPDILETNGAVRLLRLAQLTSGHTSKAPTIEPPDDQVELFIEPEVEFTSNEKLKYTVNYLTEWSSAEASVVWCRFRPERERLVKLLRDEGIATFEVYGGQNRNEREDAKRAFNPLSRGTGRRVLVAQPHAGGKGLDFAAATEALYQSNDWSLEWRLQSEDRSHRSGTIEKVAYYEILATGPTGQKTIDHTILTGLRKKQDLATWTCSAWRKALLDEEKEDTF